MTQYTTKRISKSPRSIGKQDGISLLEVLMALVILAIGLTGLAIMHLNSLKSVHSAYQRSIASSIALDLEEHLWLAVAEDLTSYGCPALTGATGEIAEFETVWAKSNPDAWVMLEGLDISLNDKPGVTNPRTYVRPGGTLGNDPAYVEFDLVFTWGDGAAASDADGMQKFIQQEVRAEQRFEYTARIYCSSNYVTTIPAP